jgi:hypothetical protein
MLILGFMLDKKRSFYKSVCIIDIACVATFILVSGYRTFFTLGQQDNTRADNIGIFSAIAVIFSTSIVSDMLGIRLINKFPAHAPIKKVFQNSLIVFFVLLCGFFILLACCDYMIADDLIKRNSGESSYHYYDWQQTILSFEFILLSFTSLYKIIFTWKLVKDVKKNHADFYTSIDTIGTIE